MVHVPALKPPLPHTLCKWQSFLLVISVKGFGNGEILLFVIQLTFLFLKQDSQLHWSCRRKEAALKAFKNIYMVQVGWERRRDYEQ